MNRTLASSMSQHSSRILAIAGGSALLLAAGLATGTLAFAHGGPPATGVIHTCVNNSSGTFKVVAADAVCKTNESALDWNAEGIPGAAGTNGLDGLNGTNGTNGADGTNGAPGADGEDGLGGPFIVGNVDFGGSPQGGGYTSFYDNNGDGNGTDGCYVIDFPAGSFPGDGTVWTNVTPFAVSEVPQHVLVISDEEDIVTQAHQTVVCFVGFAQASFNFITGENAE